MEKEIKITLPQLLVLIISTIIITSIVVITIPVGKYFEGSGEIIVKTNGRSIKDIEKTCYHELGHHIWSKILNDKEREEYLCINNETTDINKLSEDFAENIEEYAIELSYLDEEREEFFHFLMYKYRK